MLKYFVNFCLFLCLITGCRGRSGSGVSDSGDSAHSFCCDSVLHLHVDSCLLNDSELTTLMDIDQSSPLAVRRPVTSGALDWNLFRGNTSLSGYSDNSLPNNPALLWTFNSEARTNSSPVVANGITYWSDRRGHIRGVNMNGEQVFSHDFQTAVEATPMIHDGILYIGRIDGFMYAVSLSQNSTLWNFETMGQVNASANHINFEGRHAVVFGSYDNYLYCLDSKTGEKINRFESGYYINGAVALMGQYAIFGGCDSWLRIIDAQNGVATDSLLLENYIPESPAVIGNYFYVGDYGGNIYQIRLENGKIANHKVIMSAISDNASFSSVPAVTSESLYILASDQHLYSISRSDGSINWRYMLKGEAGDSSPVVCRDRVIVCTRSGIVSILNVRTGALEWEYDTGEQVLSSPAVIRDRFYILTNRGTLFCFGVVAQ